MLIERKAIVVAGVLLVFSQPHYVLGAEQLDKYGGSLRVVGRRAESFHLEKIANRWWLVTPDGHGIFVRAASKVDTSDYGGSGGFLAYDGVYLQNAAGAISGNLRAAAENSLTRDVVQPVGKVTLKSKGDVFYLGSSRFKPNYTYFWLEQSGEGGKLLWYYSTTGSWKPIRNSGKPYKGAALNKDGSFHLDIGNYMAPDENGFGQWETRGQTRSRGGTCARVFQPILCPQSCPATQFAATILRRSLRRISQLHRF